MLAVEPLSREEFVFLSEEVEEFLRLFCGPSQVDDWLESLAFFGRDIGGLFRSMEVEIVKACSADTVTTCNPWQSEKTVPIIFTGATAHECAGFFMNWVWQMIFIEHPDFRDRRQFSDDLKTEVPKWIAAHRTDLIERMRRLDVRTEYSQILSLRAALKAERLKLLVAWGGVIADSSAVAEMESAGAEVSKGISVERGEAIRMALRSNHDFTPGVEAVGNQEPISWQDVERLSGQRCGRSTWFSYFNDRLGENGVRKYTNACANRVNLMRELNRLCEDLPPDEAKSNFRTDDYYGGRPDTYRPGRNSNGLGVGDDDEDVQDDDD